MRRAVAAIALALVGASARAAEQEQREFAVEIGARDPVLREDCSRRMSTWWDELTSAERAPDGWDADRFGPWPLVVRTSGWAFQEERPGLVRVIVFVGADELRSRQDTANALAQAFLDGLRKRVAERASAMRGREQLLADNARVTADRSVQELRAQLAQLEKTHGGPPERRALALADRLAQVERDASQTRIDRAVAAKKLESARTGVEQAVALERLRVAARELEHDIENLPNDREAPDRKEADEKLARLRDRIDALTRTCPPLEAARQEAFRLEVDLVGLEVRGVALDAEIQSLRAEAARASDDASRHAPLARELRSAETDLDNARARLRKWIELADESGPAFEVVRPVGPPAPGKSKEEKR